MFVSVLNYGRIVELKFIWCWQMLKKNPKHTLTQLKICLLGHPVFFVVFSSFH